MPPTVTAVWRRFVVTAVTKLRYKTSVAYSNTIVNNLLTRIRNRVILFVERRFAMADNDNRTQYVMVRMSEDEKAELRELAWQYRLGISELVRLSVRHVNVNRPALQEPTVIHTPATN